MSQQLLAVCYRLARHNVVTFPGTSEELNNLLCSPELPLKAASFGILIDMFVTAILNTATTIRYFSEDVRC